MSLTNNTTNNNNIDSIELNQNFSLVFSRSIIEVDKSLSFIIILVVIKSQFVSLKAILWVKLKGRTLCFVST